MHPGRAGNATPLPHGSKPIIHTGSCSRDADCTPGRVGSMLPVGDAEAPATTAAVSMEVEQGATSQAGSSFRRRLLSCSASTAPVAA